jgi:hypothetical protein
MTLQETKEMSNSASYTMSLAFAGGGFKDTTLVPRRYTLAALSDRLKHVRVGPKDGSYLIRGGDLSICKRSDENLQSAELIILDGDSSIDPETGEILTGAPSFHTVHEALKEMNVAHIMHTSHSNRGSDGVVSFWKYRILIPCKMQSQEELTAAVDYFIAELHKRQIWINGVNENYRWSQPWFLPRVSKEEERERFVHRDHLDGYIFNIDTAVSWQRETEQQNQIIDQIKNTEAAAPPVTSTTISQFNEQHGLEWMRATLASMGYRFSHYDKRNDAYRYLAPTSQTGAAGVMLFKGSRGDWVTYSHHGAHDILSQKVVDPFALYAIANFSGDNSAAVRSLQPREKSITEQLSEIRSHNVATDTTVSGNSDTLSPAPKKRIEILRMDELKDEAVQWLIEDLVPAKAFAAIYGKPGSFKSFVAIYLSQMIAAGQPAFGKPTAQGTCLYIAGEGQAGLKKRSDASRITHEIEPSVPLYFIKRSLNLSSTLEDMQELIKEIRELGIAPSLIVVDTLARNFVGDENSSSDMSQFIAVIGELIAQLGCTVLVVHHAGKDESKGMRGSSALLGAVDAELECVRTSDEEDREHLTGKLTTTKQKESEDGIEFHFEMVKVLTDPVDPNIVSLGLKPSEKQLSKKRQKKQLSESEIFTLEAFDLAVSEVGKRYGTPGIPPDKLCIRRADWLAYFRHLCAGDDKFSERTYQRAAASLSMAKIIAAKGDVLWKTEQHQHVTEKPDKPTLPDMS